jgi:hypothetical protein
MRIARLAGSVIVSLVALVATLLVCEAIARVVNGAPLSSLRLPATPPAEPSRRSLDPTLGGGLLPPDVDPAWVDSAPPPLPRGPVDPQLLEWSQHADTYGVFPFEMFRVWNRRFVEQFGCRPGSTIARLPTPLLVFDPPEPNPLPPYRYRPSSTLPGLITNRFGWRGPEIPLDKPPGTVRLAFAGASTTVAYAMPFSYPEYVVYWLNLWAERSGRSVRFDGINAAREGLNSTSIAAVIRQEVLPAEPDLVLYYEGANQSICLHPPPDPPLRPAASLWWGVLQWAGAAASGYSQLGRLVQGTALRMQAHGGFEPAKPVVDLGWPSDLDERHPDIMHGTLPLDLNLILTDLDSVRTRLSASGSTLALASFEWLVYDGLRLDPRRSLAVFRNLNEGCWPYRYADIRRAVDLHNRVMEDYAAAYGLPFIDIAAAFPPDPDLFQDAVHLNADGTRAQAWIVFRALLPIVRARLDAGAWPRPDQVQQGEPAAFGTPLTFSCDAAAQ